MSSSSNLLPLLLSLALLLLLCNQCKGGADFTVSHCEKADTKDQPNLTVGNKTIMNLLKLTPQKNIAYSYNEPGIFGMAWCRGDFSPEKCSTCLEFADKTLFELCSHEATEARIVYQDFCYLRLGNKDFFKTLDVDFGRLSRDNSTSREIGGEQSVAYWGFVEGLLKEVKHGIMNAKGSKFVTRQVSVGDEEKMEIYGMGECVQGITEKQCFGCLVKTFLNMMESCKPSTSCEGFLGSCFLQYSTKY